MRVNPVIPLTILLFVLVLTPVLAINPTWIYSTGKGDPILDLDIAPDGSYVAATDGALYLFSSNADLWVKGPAAKWVDITNDSTLFATASDINVCLYSRTGVQEWCNADFPGKASDIIISDDETTLYTSSDYDGRVYRFTGSGTLAWSSLAGTPVYSLAAPPSGAWVTGIAYFERFFGVNSDGSGRFSYTPDSGYNLPLIELAVTRDGRYILGVTEYGTTGKIMVFDRYGVQLWSNQTEGINGRFAASDEGDFIAVGTEIVSSVPRGALYLFRVNTTANDGYVAWKHPMNAPMRAVAMNRSGSLIAVGDANGMISLYERHENLLWQYKAETAITRIAILNDGTAVAAGTQAGKIYYFSNASGFTAETTPVTPEVTPENTTENITPTVTVTVSPTPTTAVPPTFLPGQPITMESMVVNLILVVIAALLWVAIYVAYKKNR
jgi:hypothetical protein